MTTHHSAKIHKIHRMKLDCNLYFIMQINYAIHAVCFVCYRAKIKMIIYMYHIFRLI